MTTYRIGCDIGGTFTDIILSNDESGEIHVHKLLSTPPNFEEAVINGVSNILKRHAIDPLLVSFFCHSSTVALNTLVERKGNKTALLTTHGFRDVLEIGRGAREHEFDFFQTKPLPLVPRNLRFGIDERINYEGQIIHSLNEDQVLKLTDQLRREQIMSIAVAYLNSYTNPVHEQRTKELILSIFPEANVSISSDINPIYREYERTSSTVINAYIARTCENYLSNLERKLKALGIICPIYITQSSGGLMTIQAAKDRTIHMLMAGPAAGVKAAAYYARITNYDKAVCLDIGGTTQLVSLIENGDAQNVVDVKVSGYPVCVPMIDVRAIGAGGGSIARVDDGGRLCVGPDSAGASPGPICYGRGGTEPTVTDADVVLGYLNPEFFLGGGLSLNKESAEEGIYQKIGHALGLNVYQSAAGIIEVVNSERIGAIRKLLLEQGHDPRDFAMIAFGGAGPVHAAELAEEMGFKAVVIPAHPGLSSPVGSLSAELQRDYIQTIGVRLDNMEPRKTAETALKMADRAITELSKEGICKQEIQLSYQADVKYVGQLGDLTVDIPAPTDRLDLKLLQHTFYAEHDRLFGYHSESEPLVLTNLRVTARFHFPNINIAKLKGSGSSRDPIGALKGTRLAYFKKFNKLIDCPVYDRSQLQYGNEVTGPAILEEYDSTTVVYPRQVANVDEYGNLVITF